MLRTSCWWHGMVTTHCHLTDTGIYIANAMIKYHDINF
jgi:hypothetical protein